MVKNNLQVLLYCWVSLRHSNMATENPPSMIHRWFSLIFPLHCIIYAFIYIYTYIYISNINWILIKHDKTSIHRGYSIYFHTFPYIYIFAMCFPTCFPLVFLGSPVRLDLRRLGGLQVPKPGATAGAGSWPVDPALVQLNFRKYGNYGNSDIIRTCKL